MSHLLAHLVLPFTRLELPGWGRIATLPPFNDPDAWRDAPTRTVRGKWHRYEMTLDLRDPGQRRAWMLARFTDLPTWMLIRAILRPGDSFVDVGANIGMVTLLAARCVGPSGRVESFEPNPRALARLRHHVAANELRRVTVHPAGLSDTSGELVLRMLSAETSKGTFGDLRADEAGRFAEEHVARVERGDDVLDLPSDPPLTVKIDVEGFECRALRGLEDTLRRHRPAVTHEAVPQHLARAHSTVRELFDLLEAHELSPYGITAPRIGLRQRLRLIPIPCAGRLPCRDLVWLAPGGIHARRLAGRFG